MSLKTGGLLVVLAGLLAALLGLLADTLGVGGQSGFGWKQAVLVGVGVVLMLAGGGAVILSRRGAG